MAVVSHVDDLIDDDLIDASIGSWRSRWWYDISQQWAVAISM
jgi:hypothetical protein